MSRGMGVCIPCTTLIQKHQVIKRKFKILPGYIRLQNALNLPLFLTDTYNLLNQIKNEIEIYSPALIKSVVQPLKSSAVFSPPSHSYVLKQRSLNLH